MRDFDYRCPNCKDADCIDISARVWVRLLDDRTDADESEDGSHDWDEDSAAQCARCGYHGKVRDFATI